VEASYKDGQDVKAKLDALLTDDRYAAAARAFKAKYADFDPAAQVGRMVDRVEELLEGAGPARPAAAPRRAGRALVPAGVFRE
jgi:hypothetical protein